MASKMYVNNDFFEVDLRHLNTSFHAHILTKHSIVVGDVNGQLQDVFSKLAKLHAKNKFAFAIIAGNFFADETTSTDAQKQELQDLLDGKTQVPLTTYFSLGNRPLPSAVIEKLSKDQGELCENLSILGRKYTGKTVDGFKIAAIGGTHASAEDDAMDEYAPTYTDKDVESIHDYKTCDILVTNDWPAEVRDGSKVTYAGDSPAGVSAISELCTTLKPRYHFSASERIYQREAFFHAGSTPRPITHFVSLAPLNNPNKEKAIFAFSLEPNGAPPQSVDGCTASPFFKKKTGLKRKAETSEDGAQNGYRYSSTNGNGFPSGPRRQPKRQRHVPYKPTQQECVFCLARDEVKTHMITSISKHAYMTIAKGPLTTKDTFPGLDLPLHMLIIPVAHTPTFAALSEKPRAKALDTMQKYRDAIHTLISVKATSGSDDEAKFGTVTWEYSKAGGFHLHWQVVPVPIDLVKKRVIEAACDAEAENLKYPKFAKSTSAIADAEEGDYLKIMIWSESSEKELVLPIDDRNSRDLQFPRRVLAKLLKLENRVRWQSVEQPEAEEEAYADAFKSAFEEYDFSLQGPPEEDSDEEQAP